MAADKSQDLARLLSEMIRINTVSPPGNEKDLALYIAGILRSNGLEPTIQDLGDNRANIFCEIGEGDECRLILNGHLDVVPAEGEWKHDPFESRIDGEYLYGRGACDMKAGLACMLQAFIDTAKEESRLKGRLKIFFVTDEETSNLGLRSYISEYGEKDRLSAKRNYALIGEPTDLNVCNSHYGVERYWINVHGVSAHSSKPELGVNAISGAAAIVDSLSGYHKELRSRVTEWGSPSCAVTMIEGGEKQNSIPVLCSLFLDRRTVPGEDGGQVAKEVEQWIASHADMHGCTCSVEPFFSFASGLLDERSGFLGKAKEIVGQQTDLVFPAGCEQAIFISGGYDAIVLGPGSIEMAHKIDEYVPLEELEKAVDIYEKFISILLDQSSCAIG